MYSRIWLNRAEFHGGTNSYEVEPLSLRPLLMLTEVNSHLLSVKLLQDVTVEDWCDAEGNKWCISVRFARNGPLFEGRNLSRLRLQQVMGQVNVFGLT